LTDAIQTKEAIGDIGADWLIVDHYALDFRWEAHLRSCCRHIMAIDDLADRKQDCDLLLDQNLGRVPAEYDGLVPSVSKILTGPKYSLLRPEFAALRSQSLARRDVPQLRNLLITMGGVDKDNTTGKVLNALKRCALLETCHITVVMGPHAPWLSQVRTQAAQMPWHTDVLVNAEDMARLMSDSDLAIGAAGTTSWERCCLFPRGLFIIGRRGFFSQCFLCRFWRLLST
jgi:UDP-2,4-diacetamido-2,4,6-trideoxy-beta-L-altropyranose hydrolase